MCGLVAVNVELLAEYQHCIYTMAVPNTHATLEMANKFYPILLYFTFIFEAKVIYIMGAVLNSPTNNWSKTSCLLLKFVKINQ